MNFKVFVGVIAKELRVLLSEVGEFCDKLLGCRGGCPLEVNGRYTCSLLVFSLFFPEADCQAEKDLDFTKIDRYYQHNRSSPAGPTTERKVRSHEILFFFCARFRILVQVF